MKYNFIKWFVMLSVVLMAACSTQHGRMSTSFPSSPLDPKPHHIFLVTAEGQGDTLSAFVEKGRRFLQGKGLRVGENAKVDVWVSTRNATNSAVIAYHIPESTNIPCVYFDLNGIPVYVENAKMVY